MARLSGKVILVTGAAGDVGSAICRAVARDGGTPIGTDVEARGEIKTILDVTSEADWSRVTAEIEQTPGHLDGLVNAAGIAALGTIESADFAQWRRVLSVNLDGAFLGCKHAFVLMRHRGGTIVNIASVYGHVGNPMLTAYAASKGGVRLLTKAVALHGAGLNPKIRCNSVSPAFLDGPMVDAVLGTNSNVGKQYLKRDIPLGRLGTADEVAALCNYLLSDDSAFVTGADFPIDGGLLAR